MSSFTRFVILLSEKIGVVPTDTLVKGHVAFLRKLDKDGRLVMCGPFTNVKGGMIVLKADSLEEATALALTDPLVASGVRNYEVRSWELSCEENNHLGRG